MMDTTAVVIFYLNEQKIKLNSIEDCWQYLEDCEFNIFTPFMWCKDKIFATITKDDDDTYTITFVREEKNIHEQQVEIAKRIVKKYKNRHK